MAVPYRLFYRLHLLQCRGTATNNNYDTAAKWEDVHREQSRILSRKNTTDWEFWYVLYRGYAEDGWGLAGADKVLDVDTTVEYLVPYLNSLDQLPFIAFTDKCGVYYDTSWLPATATGRNYDGVNPFPFFPHRYWENSGFNWAGHTVYAADVPGTRNVIHEAWDNNVHNAHSLLQSAEILANGMLLGIAGWNRSQIDWHIGDGLGIDVNIKSVKLRYFNACADRFTPNRGASTGGWPLVIRGLGFANLDAEINSKSGPANQQPWGDTTQYLYIESPDGTVVATLRPGAPWFDYTVDSNTQITINSMPALPAGLYQIRIRKQPNGIDTYSYAGDWRFDIDGRMTPGARLYLWIYDVYIPPRIPIIRTRWRWIRGTLEVFKYYAPIDVRAAATFYEGMILGTSSFTRGTSDLTGLPLFPDLEIELDNTTREFSKLLTQYRCKNQLVEVWHGWQEEPEAFDELIYSGIVSDYERPGSTWKVRLRDIMEKYFSTRIPKYRCTISDYPSIHQNHIGREMPEVLGQASLTEGSSPGAVEAIYVDTSAFKYLAARGSLYAITEVYADGALVAPADYVVSYEDGGRTYITFTADKEDAKVTFNCQGYSYADWDSAGSYGGFVQNPAYIILFLLAFFAEAPDICIDIPAFDDLALVYESLGYDLDGYLIMQDEQDAATYLQQLLFTYGAKIWTTSNNQITIGRKDAADFSTNVHYFEQIDALDEPQRPQGFDRAVNYAPVKWRHYPTANLFMGSKIITRPSSITAFEAEISPSQAWDMPWTTAEGLVDLRATEELLKLGFGDQKIILPLSIEHIGELDILENFRYQDPYGLDPLGVGEFGHYYYVESITYDVMAGKITLTGIDAQWILRQTATLGDSSILPANWSGATEAERIYFYLCDSATCSFADGEPGKVLIDCGG